MHLVVDRDNDCTTVVDRKISDTPLDGVLSIEKDLVAPLDSLFHHHGGSLLDQLVHLCVGVASPSWFVDCEAGSIRKPGKGNVEHFGYCRPLAREDSSPVWIELMPCFIRHMDP